MYECFPSCMHVNHVRACCPSRSEERVGSPGSEVTDSCHSKDAENWTGFSRRVSSTLKSTEPSLQPQPWLILWVLQIQTQVLTLMGPLHPLSHLTRPFFGSILLWIKDGVPLYSPDWPQIYSNLLVSASLVPLMFCVSLRHEDIVLNNLIVW